ncbi:MAG: transcriptional regulator, partial [Mesorhizobium sp.]
THDIITRLAKLRDFFVIARGSVFALAEKDIAPEDAGRRLNVDYVATGSVRSLSGRVIVSVELVEVRTARIVWAETFEHRPDEIFTVIDDIGNSIVSSIAAEIATVERNRAMLKAPNSLNAWEAYHRGLWHMYRFTRQENELAQQFFNDALKLDPTFARAYAGLSFTHWQNAFQRWGDRDREASLAFATAGHSLLVDDRNPAAHWAMGRALWLRGEQDGSLLELAKAVDLSPNFALGHYALSFVHSQSGDPQSAIGSSDHSRHLSPFDPLLFGMMGARAMAHARLGEYDEAAEWALKAAARPNAHVIILAIAAHCLALAGRQDEARNFAAAIRTTWPDYRADDFIATFRFDRDGEALFRRGAKLIGLN